MIDEGRFFDRDGCRGFDKLFQSHPIIWAHPDHFHRDPVLVDFCDYRELDIDKGFLAFQPQLDVYRIPNPQMIRGAEFMPILQAFEYAPVGFKLDASVREHAVDCKFRTSPRDLSHHGMQGSMERGVRLFLKRWGRAYSNRVVCG